MEALLGCYFYKGAVSKLKSWPCLDTNSKSTVRALFT